jgi:hypothetical protein
MRSEEEKRMERKRLVGAREWLYTAVQYSCSANWAVWEDASVREWIQVDAYRR